jgi:hypothetical protein
LTNYGYRQFEIETIAAKSLPIKKFYTRPIID